MRYAFFCVLLMTSTPVIAAAQKAPAPQYDEMLSYADLADFALASKIVAQVQIRKIRPLKGEMGVATLPGRQRLLVSADILSLLTAPSGQPKQIKYLLDAPLDSRGKLPRLVRTSSLIFALPARPGEVQLIAPDAAIAWTPERDTTVRAILSEAAQREAPPAVRGIASAFYSRGSLTGEGETQIFLDTQDNRPASLTVQRRTDAQPKWFVSLGEVVDEGTSQPRPNSLLWYRLACFLPETVPEAAVEGQSTEDTVQLGDDYRLIKSALGDCPRRRQK